MFLTFGEEKCPVCGVSGENCKIEGLSVCPKCGTKFNKFGIILAKDKSPEIHCN